jgi:aldehyde dehydrogenase (NAD+)
MPEVFKHTFDTPVYKGTTEFNTGLYINGKWVDGADGGVIE